MSDRAGAFADPPVPLTGDARTDEELSELLQKALAPSFVLVRRIGAGGMGIVYLARDPALKRDVAVKVMAPEHALNPDTRQRFQREAEAVAAISHPNVVAVYSVGTLDNGLPYLVMQYVDGPSMADRLALDGPLDLEMGRRVIGQVAAGLDAAHRRGIIHRDIKPANILWDEESGRALVTDFGIASILDSDFDGETLRLTQTGTSVGTPRYMSPEQLLSEPLTPRTDMYSLGLLGYELLAGESPYQAATSPAALFAAHLRDAPRPLTQLRPDADIELEALLAACLAKDAESRPTGEEVARRLHRESSTLLEWPPPGLEELQGRAPTPINQMFWGALAIVVPLTMVVTTDPSSPFRLGWPGSLAYPILAAMGGVAGLAGLVESLRLLRRAVHAARGGYGWGIIAEVLVDDRHDTGRLIVGEREYAPLSVEQRNLLRRWRVARWALRGAGAAGALLAPAVALTLAARTSSPATFAIASLLAPVAALAASVLVGRREARMLEPIRDRMRSHSQPPDRLSHLASTWKDAFERVGQGLMRGQGRFGRVVRRVAGVAALAAMCAVGATAAFGTLMLATQAEVARSRPLDTYSDVIARVNWIENAAAFRPAIDPAITPLRAGYALQSLAFLGRVDPNPLYAPVKFPLTGGQDWSHGELMNGEAIRMARRGLTPAERARFERAAASPGAAELSILARARQIDWIDAALVKPLPPSTMVSEVPFTFLNSLRYAAYINVARAAIAVADGNVAAAESYLRDNIGAGLAIMDLPMKNQTDVGQMLVVTGRAGLRTLYDVTNQPDKTRALSAPELRALPVVDMARLNPADAAAFVRSFIGNDAIPRGLRWEMMSSRLAFEPCTDLRQMLFGPSAAHLADLAAARAKLVQTPGDESLMTLVEHQLDGGRPIAYSGSVSHRVAQFYARVIDRLTGSGRMQTCLGLFY